MKLKDFYCLNSIFLGEVGCDSASHVSAEKYKVDLELDAALGCVRVSGTWGSLLVPLHNVRYMTPMPMPAEKATFITTEDGSVSLRREGKPDLPITAPPTEHATRMAKSRPKKA